MKPSTRARKTIACQGFISSSSVRVPYRCACRGSWSSRCCASCADRRSGSSRTTATSTLALLDLAGYSGLQLATGVLTLVSVDCFLGHTVGSVVTVDLLPVFVDLLDSVTAGGTLGNVREGVVQVSNSTLSVLQLLLLCLTLLLGVCSFFLKIEPMPSPK